MPNTCKSTGRCYRRPEEPWYANADHKVYNGRECGEESILAHLWLIPQNREHGMGIAKNDIRMITEPPQ